MVRERKGGDGGGGEKWVGRVCGEKGVREDGKSRRRKEWKRNVNLIIV
jgi:hypothetical protein